jgi:tRNA nucleotidyltransferase (CCA-adding enzyme)
MSRTPQRLDYHPEGDVWTHTELVMNYAAQTWGDPEITWACFTHDFGKPYCWEEYETALGHEKDGLRFIEGFCKRWRLPNSYRDLSLLVCEHHTKVHGCMGRSAQGWTRPKSIMALFEKTGALSHTERFKKVLKACAADAKGRGKEWHEDKTKTKEYYLNKPYHQRPYLEECLKAVLELDTKSISSKLISEGREGKFIGEQIRVTRIDAIRQVQRKWKEKQ